MVVEAAVRLLQPGFAGAGAIAAGEAFDVGDFLRSLAPAPLRLGWVRACDK